MQKKKKKSRKNMLIVPITRETKTSQQNTKGHSLLYWLNILFVQEYNINYSPKSFVQLILSYFK